MNVACLCECEPVTILLMAAEWSKSAIFKVAIAWQAKKFKYAITFVLMVITFPKD